METLTMDGTSRSAAQTVAVSRFLDAYQREHATTLKLLKAFPAAQSEFQPHATSQTARALAWTFVLEQGGMAAVLKNEFSLPEGGFPLPPASWHGILDMFAAQSAEIVTLLRSMRDDDLSGTVQFLTGPKRVGDVPKIDLLWFFLCDQIHHRGQLSVYLRMAGGRVPSIYGPSADEPWT
jgi:uncharacterized damage-inducible protein DinB